MERCEMALLPNTIRGQIMAAFLSCFVFMGIIIALNYSNFRSLSRSMQFFEIAEELNKNLLEMRRYEKNFSTPPAGTPQRARISPVAI
jgi:hypothetical protein